MPQNTFDEEIILVQVMVWYGQATSHYLNQYISTWRHRPQLVNLLKTRQIRRHFADAIFKFILLNEGCFYFDTDFA